MNVEKNDTPVLPPLKPSLCSPIHKQKTQQRLSVRVPLEKQIWKVFSLAVAVTTISLEDWLKAHTGREVALETEVKISSIWITQLPELDQSSLFSFRVASSIVYGTEASEIWHFSQIYFIFKEHEKLTFCVLKFLKWRKNITSFFLKILQTHREVEKIIPSVSLRMLTFLPYLIHFSAYLFWSTL